MVNRILLLFLILLTSCENKVKFPSAQDIVDRAITQNCGTHCEQLEIAFDFRDRSYRSTRRGGQFRFERMTKDSLGVIKDVLDNEGFKRYRNDTLLQVADSMARKYANSVNAVHYFMRLPYGLNDSAVKKKFVDTISIKGEPYYRVEVSFQKDGGGDDFEDIFLYWFHREDYSMDYLAYSYETDGGGVRFREAYNKTKVNGIWFADYRNYKPKSKNTALESLDSLFLAGELELLSKIENKNIRVTLLED